MTASAVEIEIAGATDRQATEITAALREILAAYGRSHGSLAITVVDAATMHTLNRDALQHDWHTDVLSWNYGPETQPTPDDPATEIDGEIVLSRDYAAQEAAARGHDTDAEVLLYAIHGLLHILGYDDQDPAAKATMEAEQHRWWQTALARR